MSLLRLVVLTMLVTSAALVTGGAAPAFACSCAYNQTSDFVAAADEIFTGTLVRMVDPPQSGVVSSSDPVTYTVEVDGVHRGDVASVATFESAMSGASCGLEGMVVGERYLVFASIDGSRRTSSSCSGTAAAAPGLERAVARLAGAPMPPLSGTDVEPTATPAVASADDPEGTAVTSWATGVGVALVVGGLVVGGLVALGLRRRHRAH